MKSAEDAVLLPTCHLPSTPQPQALPLVHTFNCAGFAAPYASPWLWYQLYALSPGGIPRGSTGCLAPALSLSASIPSSVLTPTPPSCLLECSQPGPEGQRVGAAGVRPDRGCANCQSLPQAELFVRQRERPGPSQIYSMPDFSEAP